MTNVEYTLKLVADLEAAGKRTPRDDATAITLDEATRQEREEKKDLGEEFDLTGL